MSVAMTSSNGNIFRVTGPLCGWVNNREAGDFRCHRGHYDVTVMFANIMTNCNRILQVRPYENHIIFPDTLYPSSLLYCHQNSDDTPSTNVAALKNMGKYSRYVLTMYDHSKAKLEKPRSYFTSWKIHNVFIYHRLWLWSKTSLNARCLVSCFNCQYRKRDSWAASAGVKQGCRDDKLGCSR